MQNSPIKEIVNITIETPISWLNLKTSALIRSYSPHWHEETEILVILRGDMLVDIGNDSKMVKAGDVVISNANEIHTGISGKNGVDYYIMLINFNLVTNEGYLSKKYIEPIAKQHIGFKHFITDQKVFNVAKSMYETINTGNNNPLSYCGLIYYLVAVLYENGYAIKNKPQTNNKAINEVTDYINNNYIQKISVKEISDKFGYSEAYFCRFFKKHVGITPAKYINTLRLLQAKKLLLETDTSIAQIASNCGFADVFYFSSVFKKQYGISPTKFKENRDESLKVK